MTAIANIFPIIKPLSALHALPVYPRKRGVNCVNFGRRHCETKDDGWCSARDAEPRMAVAPDHSGLRITCGAQKLEAGATEQPVNCVNFGTANMMHQVQL